MVLMGEISMTQPSLSRLNEPCTGACLCSLGSDPRQRLGVGKAETLTEVLTCLPGQGCIYRRPFPGCQAEGKWEQRC